MAGGDLWFFDRIAPAYDWLVPDADPAVLRSGLARAGRDVERVLDVAGGTGRAIRPLDAPERIVLDASPGMLDQVSPGLGRVLASASALPVRNEAVDAVLIVDALHHLPTPGVAIAEAARVLRPGGVLVIQDFDPGTLRGRLLAAAEHLIRMESTFLAADGVLRRMADAGLDASAMERGFSYTVAGTKPGRS